MGIAKEQETKLLLGDAYRDITPDTLPSRSSYNEVMYSSRQHFYRHHPITIALICHTILICIYSITTAAAILYMKEKCSHGPDLVYSPAKSVIERYEARYWPLIKATNNFTGPYSGWPTPEIDQNWEDFMKNLNVRLTEEEVDKLGGIPDGVQLPDEEGGYMADLMVYHELHCLMRLRWNLYPEWYFPNADAAKLDRNREHSEHCIDLLRASTQCRSDTTVLAYQWINSRSDPVLNFGRPHECVNFEAVEAWATSRRVEDAGKPGWLQHPELGAAFPEGEIVHAYRYPNVTREGRTY